MHVPDLLRFPDGHPPSPYPVPIPLERDEIWGTGRLEDRLLLLAIGWLGDSVPTSGPVPAEVVDALLSAYQRRAIVSDGFAGWHDCELCPGPGAWYHDGEVGPVIHWQGQAQRPFGHGHYLVRAGDIVFMAPALLLHYILDHGYRPPDQFLSAVSPNSFLTTEDLVWDPPIPPQNPPAA
jgi:hypothetical protein